jgi:hypothetical protein
MQRGRTVMARQTKARPMGGYGIDGLRRDHFLAP